MQESELAPLTEPRLLENRHSFQDLVRNGAGCVFLDAESTVFGMEFFDWAASRVGIEEEVKNVTNAAMGSAQADFNTAVSTRLAMVPLNRRTLMQAREEMRKKVIPDLFTCINGLQNVGIHVAIISGGFSETIPELIPGVSVHANHLSINSHDNVVGWHNGEILAQSGGKRDFLSRMNAKGNHNGKRMTVMIGDGMNDKIAVGTTAADLFVPFGYWQDRESVRNGEPFSASGIAPLFVVLTGEKNWKKILEGRDPYVKDLLIRGALDIINERNVRFNHAWDRIFLVDRLESYLRVSISNGNIQ